MPHPTRTPAWAVGMRKIGPGVYVDSARALHISEREICDHFDVPYSPENSKVIEEVAQEVIREMYGELPTSVIKEAAGADKS